MNELTFLDLAILKKIDANSSVENFGSQINTSFFETANLLGTLKIKGYVNIETSIGGISKVTITDAGMGIIALAEKKAADPVEPLDNALLHALAGGAKDPESLQSSLNIRSGDLAYHINKMVAQGLMDYQIRSAKANLMLTEQGFNSTGGVKVQGAPAVAAGAQKQPEATEAKKEEKPPEEKKEHKVKEDILHILRGGEKEEKTPDTPAHAHVQAKETASRPHEHATAHKEYEHEERPGHAARHEQEAHNKEGTHDEPPAPPKSPEEEKRQEQSRRKLSKLQYYISEYWAWIILIIIATVIFASAVYSMISKMV